MRTKTLNNAKLIVTVESNKVDKKINTISVYDNIEQRYWMDNEILERGITWFLDINDMEETLNWNLNGDNSKYQFKWGQTTKCKSEGRAYIFH